MRYLKLNDVLDIHHHILEQFGGLKGIRDFGALEAALAQPKMTFEGEDLYPTLVDKAVAIGYSLINNHPFADGNKRIGHAAMEIFLLLNGFEVEANIDEQEQGLGQLDSVNLGNLLTAVVEQLQRPARNRQVALKLSLPAQVNLHLQGDTESLRQVFTNLIDNALKYTLAGGQVSVTAGRNWQEITASVSDTGPGIPSQHLPHLFERFYRVDSARARDTGGFGLGLAISKTIVQAHEGQLIVDSQLDYGTTFTVTLPVGQPEISL